MGILNRGHGTRERLLCFTVEGDMLSDPRATKIDNELISDKLGHAYDSPAPTPTYEVLELGRAAARTTAEVVIIHEPEHHDRDTKFVVERSQGHWESYATGIRREQENPMRRAYHLIWGWLSICVVIFIILAWMAMPAYQARFDPEATSTSSAADSTATTDQEVGNVANETQ